MKLHHTVIFKSRYPYTPGSGGIAHLQIRMSLQIFDQTNTCGLLDFQPAYIDQTIVRRRIRLHPGLFKGIFCSVNGQKGSLSGGLHQTVTASVILIRDMNQDGNPPGGELLFHVIPISSGAYRRDEGVRRF
jgi:hypothetical protein